MLADFANGRPVTAIADFVANEFVNQLLPPSELFHFHFATVGLFIHESEGGRVSLPRRRSVHVRIAG